MTEEIRKAAEALIANVEEMNFIHRKESIAGEFKLKNMNFYIDLKACLRPSREELVDWLDGEFGDGYDENPMLIYIIEELRK